MRPEGPSEGCQAAFARLAACIFGAFLALGALSRAVHARETDELHVFSYASLSAAQKDWKPVEGPSVEIVERAREGRDGLRFPCPFSRAQDRCYWDAKVALNLSRYSALSLWVKLDNPAAFKSCTLYFKSGDGWYAHWFRVRRPGWQQVLINRAAFETEGKPVGWHAVDGLRFSFWKAQDKDSAATVTMLAGEMQDIVAVRGDLTIRKDAAEADAARRHCNAVVKWLAAEGLNVGVIDDTDVELGALSDYKLALFPYNPDVSDKEAEAIRKFIARGGKIILAYSLPEPIAHHVGLAGEHWQKEKYHGQLKAIRFAADEPPGLPKEVVQDSWNASIPHPAGAKVIGNWFDAEGRDTGLAAVTLHRNGAFIGHVLTAMDTERKAHLLLALMVELRPDLREDVGRQMLDGMGRMIEMRTWEDTVKFIRDRAQQSDRATRSTRYCAAAEKHLKKAERYRDFARFALPAGRFGVVLDNVRAGRLALRAAFCAAFPSKPDEFRGVWVHSALGVRGMTWDEAVERLADHGFNAVVPNMLWAGRAYYPSKLLPAAPELEQHGDQIAACLAACRRHGVKMHVWKVNWNLSGAPASFLERMKREGRLQRDRRGAVVTWLCPSDPRNFALERDSMLEVVRNYAVDGVHFDYIRYPGDKCCYCEGCRDRFQRDTGKRVTAWPQDVTSGALREAYGRWRQDQITRLVEAVSKEARRIRPGVQISAAVFADYPACKQWIGQDWVLWVERGYLDFVCPMVYTGDDVAFDQQVRRQLKNVGGKVPMYPGVGASSPGLPPEQVVWQVQLLRDAGTPGFMVFEYDTGFATEHLPALHAGATK